MGLLAVGLHCSSGANNYRHEGVFVEQIRDNGLQITLSLPVFGNVDPYAKVGTSGNTLLRLPRQVDNNRIQTSSTILSDITSRVRFGRVSSHG